MAGKKSEALVARRQRAAESGARKAKATIGLRIAEGMGLLAGAKTKHCNAKVAPKLFRAAAKRIGSMSPSAVINAALASLATEDELGPWLAKHWGALADADPELLDKIDL